MDNRKALAGILASLGINALEGGLQVSGVTSMPLAIGLWTVSAVLMASSLYHYAQSWLEKRRRTLPPIRGVVRATAVAAGIILTVIAAFATLAVMGQRLSEAEMSSYQPFDKSGVPLERGYEECAYQADLATAAVRESRRFEEVGRLRIECMRLRRY